MTRQNPSLYACIIVAHLEGSQIISFVSPRCLSEQENWGSMLLPLGHPSSGILLNPFGLYGCFTIAWRLTGTVKGVYSSVCEGTPMVWQEAEPLFSP